MFFGIVALIAGGILILIAWGHSDEERRQRGRWRTNRILTDFGGGSFGEGVSAMFGEWSQLARKLPKRLARSDKEINLRSLYHKNGWGQLVFCKRGGVLSLQYVGGETW